IAKFRIFVLLLHEYLVIDLGRLLQTDLQAANLVKRLGQTTLQAATLLKRFPGLRPCPLKFPSICLQHNPHVTIPLLKFLQNFVLDTAHCVLLKEALEPRLLQDDVATTCNERQRDFFNNTHNPIPQFAAIADKSYREAKRAILANSFSLSVGSKKDASGEANTVLPTYQNARIA